MALSLDGSGNGFTAGASSITVSITTANANDVIVVDIVHFSGSTSSISASGTGSSGLSAFAAHATSAGMERWWAVATLALSSVTLTINNSLSTQTSAIAYGISGANTSSPWDAGGPVINTVSPADPKSITTVNANTMAIATFFCSSTSNPTAGSGFTGIIGVNQQLSEYQILSSAQTLSCTMTTGNGDSHYSILDAVVAAGGGAQSFTTVGIGGSEW